MKTSEINRIEYNRDNKTGYYIGLTKIKIKLRIKEHKVDRRNNRENTAIKKLS